jgi:hypothetical protein
MFEFIRALTFAFVSTLQSPVPAEAVDEPCSPSYCCDAAWDNCRAANKNCTCPEGKLQGWCNSCYTGAGNCGATGTSCCD